MFHCVFYQLTKYLAVNWSHTAFPNVNKMLNILNVFIWKYWRFRFRTNGPFLHWYSWRNRFWSVFFPSLFSPDNLHTHFLSLTCTLTHTHTFSLALAHFLSLSHLHTFVDFPSFPLSLFWMLNDWRIFYRQSVSRTQSGGTIKICCWGCCGCY